MECIPKSERVRGCDAAAAGGDVLAYIAELPRERRAAELKWDSWDGAYVTYGGIAYAIEEDYIRMLATLGTMFAHPEPYQTVGADRYFRQRLQDHLEAKAHDPDRPRFGSHAQREHDHIVSETFLSSEVEKLVHEITKANAGFNYTDWLERWRGAESTN